MKIGTFINHGTMIEITGNQTVNLSVDKGQVRIGDRDVRDFLPAQSAEGVAELSDAPAEGVEDDGEELSGIDARLDDFTGLQVKASGIRCQPRAALALMALMRGRCTQQVDWLSFYSVLLGRGWVDANVTAFARMVNDLFGITLDQNTLNRTLNAQGTDYTRWTEADRRIVRRKQLAAEFDARLTEYFERGRRKVMEGVR